MKTLRALYQLASVQVSCAWCFQEFALWEAGEAKAVGHSKFRCGNCGNFNRLPSSLLAQLEHTEALFDPDNPVGRAEAFDNIVGNPVLKRAIELALVGYHTLTYVGFEYHGWAEVKTILGDRAIRIQRCACGYFGSPLAPCTCSMEELHEYRGRRDYKEAAQNDIIAEAFPAQAQDLILPQEPFVSVHERIKRVRFKQSFGVRAAMDTTPRNTTIEMLNEAKKRFDWGTDILRKVQRVACSIAEIEGKALVEEAHMSEAILYRTPLID